MDIVLNGIKHAAQEPKMHHWRLIQQFKTARRERAEELKNLLESGEKTTDEQQAEKVFKEIEEKAEANKQLNIDTKISILSEIFNVNFEDVSIVAVHEIYTKVEAWIDALVTGAIAKFPNGETQTE